MHIPPQMRYLKIELCSLHNLRLIKSHLYRAAILQANVKLQTWVWLTLYIPRYCNTFQSCDHTRRDCVDKSTRICFAIRGRRRRFMRADLRAIKIFGRSCERRTKMRARYMRRFDYRVHVSTRLIRKSKTLAVRARRFSISITVLLRDNFPYTRWIHGTRPTALPITVGLQLQFRS